MSEATEVQFPLIHYAAEIGWESIPRLQAVNLRGNEKGLFFTPILQAQLQRLNPDFMTDELAETVIKQLNLLKPALIGNCDALQWLRGERAIYVSKENRQRNVKLIDFDTLDNNVFQVTDEWQQQGSVYTNRTDVMLLINGIPISLVETKAPTLSDAMTIAVQQIRRTHEEVPEMLITPQVFEVTNLLDFYYGVTWQVSYKQLFEWKLESGNFEEKVKTYFNPARFLQLLKDYVVFLKKDDDLSKVILRQHQIRAVEKCLERAHDLNKRRGLIWHTQGSGKTFTMITIAAKLLRETEGMERPTVLMVVDRNELETQLFQNLTAYGLTAKIAESKTALTKLIKSDYRGLIVSMIHKFDKRPANLNKRENITVLIDEAHRSTGGDFGSYLMAALPNATFIGFTGTPIDKMSKGEGTFKVFGVDDETGYLDKYSIRESVADNTTLELHYALASSKLRVKKALLEQEFLNLAEMEGVSDVAELNKTLDKAVNLKNAMKADDRMATIATQIATHFQENVEPMGFKAFVVAVDREACQLYKAQLDQHLPPDYSQVIISPNAKDNKALKAHHLKPEDEKKLRNAFTQKDELPKIFIVTEKLLTGFDAPILYCLYLDKPMRDHVLLQTIARVNRPYQDEHGLVKPYGFILDFVGIFDNLKKALAFDKEIVDTVIKNITVLKQAFKVQMTTVATRYLPFAYRRNNQDTEQAIEHFKEKAEREAFFKFYQALQRLYTILSPDAFLQKFLKDYDALSRLYRLIRQAYHPRIYVDAELTTKTKRLLQEQTDLVNVDLPNQLYQLNAEQLKAFSNSKLSDALKIMTLRKALIKVVDEGISTKPFLISISQRAEALAQQYENRQLTTQAVLKQFEGLAWEYVQAEAEREKLGLDDNSFAIYKRLQDFRQAPEPADATTKILEKANGYQSAIKQQAQAVKQLFESFPDYRYAMEEGKALRIQLYKQLYSQYAESLVNVTDDLMQLMSR